MKRETLAINSISTRHASLEEALDAYAGAGFTGVEFCLAHVREALDAGRTPDDVRAMLADRGLRCLGGFECAVDCFAPPEKREANLARLADNAGLLAALGAGGMVVGTDGPPAGETPADPPGVIAARLGEVADALAPTGVALLLEFNWSPVVRSLRTAADVAARTGRANVGVLFDTAHYHCTPTKFTELNRENVARVGHVHLNDMRAKGGDQSHCNADRVLPGEGCLDLRAILGALEGAGYAGPYAIEMFNEALWALPAAEAAKKMYESLLPYCD